MCLAIFSFYSTPLNFFLIIITGFLNPPPNSKHTHTLSILLTWVGLVGTDVATQLATEPEKSWPEVPGS